MKRVFLLIGIALFAVSCAENEGNSTTGNSDSVGTVNTVNSGAASTGGVGAGFGSGSSTSTDTGKGRRTDSGTNRNPQ